MAGVFDCWLIDDGLRLMKKVRVTLDSQASAKTEANVKAKGEARAKAEGSGCCSALRQGKRRWSMMPMVMLPLATLKTSAHNCTQL